jgi:hypothetical protein
MATDAARQGRASLWGNHRDVEIKISLRFRKRSSTCAARAATNWIRRLRSFHRLLAQLSNEAFMIENQMRPRV